MMSLEIVLVILLLAVLALVAVTWSHTEPFTPSDVPTSYEIPIRVAVKDQERVGMCIPFSIINAYEMMTGVHLSEEFLYYTARFDRTMGFIYGRYSRAPPDARLKILNQLSEWNFDVGLDLENGLEALALYGSPPADIYPFDGQLSNTTPPPEAFAQAPRHRICNYVRLDKGRPSDPSRLLTEIKYLVANNIPVITELVMFPRVSLTSNTTGALPLPTPGDRTGNSHSVVIVGYDDALTIDLNPFPKSVGAFRVMNSWGTGWGDGGYGYIPYRYLSTLLAPEMISQKDLEFQFRDFGAYTPLMFNIGVIVDDTSRQRIRDLGLTVPPCRSATPTPPFVSTYDFFLREFQTHGIPYDPFPSSPTNPFSTS